MKQNKDKLIEIKNLTKSFKISAKKYFNAVDNLSLDIYRNETFGLVGESGCGKTTLGRTLTLIYKKSSGTIVYNGKDISCFNKRELAKKFQIIFQDPDSSLNPRMTAGDIIGEGLDIFKLYKSRAERQKKIHSALDLVGLSREHSSRFPHEFSGGQKQRIGIARALILEPEFVVCDEPISALDVSIQAQIVNLLKKLQKDRNLTLLFIAHDLSMVKYISDRIGVMYLGNLVEVAKSEELFNNPQHPYTKLLLSSIPRVENLICSHSQKPIRQGELNLSGSTENNGCCFFERCPISSSTCRDEKPPLNERSKCHYSACHNI